MTDAAPAWEWTAATLGALSQFLADAGVADGSLTATPIGDGHSNLTYLITDGTHRVVVRRPPPPPLPPGANDMLREARFLAGLADSGVPVPAVLAVAQAGQVLDVPFYVMSVVAGPVVTTRTPAPFDNELTRREIGESLVDTLASLHSVDWRARGMSDLGRPQGFNQRHLHRMARLVSSPDGSAPAGFATLQHWLDTHVPTESGASVIHNDFRIGNVVVAPETPGSVAAVLDWELATIGDPLFDLGYFLASVPEPGKPLTPTEQLGTAMLEDGYPTRAELAERYSRRAGADLSRLPWYCTLALWKLAVLYEYGRRRGEDTYYDESQVASFLEAAHQTAGI